jgi:DNA-binding SARP family transcriptional activator
MATLNVRLFGRFCIQRHGEVFDGLGAGRAEELFAYLLLHPDHSFPRETLASLFWGDCSTAQSKKYLRKALWQLLTALEVRGESTRGQVLVVEPGWVRQNPNADLWLDVAEFELAFAPARGIQGRDLDPKAVRFLRNAVELYRGDLLEGWHHDWCLYERERLQNAYLLILDKLMGYCEAHEDYEAGLEYGTRILGCDPARERTHRTLMRILWLAGDRVAALRQFERCVAALDEELGVRPDKRTQALYREIRADQFDASAPASEENTPRAGTSARLPDVLSHLKQIGSVLADLQRQIQDDIRAVERSLGRHP